jgi:hypothetical protein
MGKQGGIVVAKTLAKLTFSIAALAAATWFGTSSSRAYGDAPWCAVKTLSGDVYWNCQYRTVEEKATTALRTRVTKSRSFIVEGTMR